MPKRNKEEEHESFLDVLQQENQEGERNDMNVSGSENEVEIDQSVFEEEAKRLEGEDVMEVEKQVEPEVVVFVPQQDFDARINQEEFHFVKGVPTKITRSQANDYVDQERGYVKE